MSRMPAQHPDGQNGETSAPRSAAVLSLQRATRLMELIGEMGEAGISELARRLGWTKSMVHRQASTLQGLGYLEQDPGNGRYRLGLKLFALGSLVVRQRELRDQAIPVLETLMERCQETTHLALLDEGRGDVVYVHKVEPPQAIRLYTEVGAHHPAYCAATGKVLLAYLSDERLRRALAAQPLRRHTPRTIADPDALRAHLAQVRAQGYALDDEEYREGVRGVAAPVRDHRGQVVAAVNAGGPTSRLTDAAIQALVPHVEQAGAEISRRLGYLSPVATAGPGMVAPTRPSTSP